MKSKKPIPVQMPELATWIDLNSALMSGDLALAEKLLKSEQQGRQRKQFMLRIHSRINKLRAETERQKIRAGAAQ